MYLLPGKHCGLDPISGLHVLVQRRFVQFQHQTPLELDSVESVHVWPPGYNASLVRQKIVRHA